MGYLYTGEEGTPLSEIIMQLGNKCYDVVECRCEWGNSEGEYIDEFFGACSYDNVSGKLEPLDGDCYSLSDLYVRWREEADAKTGRPRLVVWEKGTLSSAWKGLGSDGRRRIQNEAAEEDEDV